MIEKPYWYDKKTSSGIGMGYVLMLAGVDGVFNTTSCHCGYFSRKKQCKFCDLDYNSKIQLRRGKKFRIRTKPQDMYETICEVLKSKKGLTRHMFITGGTDPRGDYSYDFPFHLDLIKAIIRGGKDTVGEDFIMPCCGLIGPYPEEYMIQLKEAGMLAYGLHLEIWDEEKFKLQCPGKAENTSHSVWEERMVKAVEIFGEGNVHCALVSGAEMAPPPYGFDTVDEAVNSTLEGTRWMVENRIVPIGVNWFQEAGSHFYDIAAPLPPLEFYAKLDLGRYRLVQGKGLSNDYYCYKLYPHGTYCDFQRLL